MSGHRINGRTAFLQLLIDEGVTHLFGNPGTTELPLMDGVPDFPQLRFVLGLQEAIVVGMADGYARASNHLTACNLHTAPGLGNGIGALYNAQFSGSPVIVTAGQYELGYGLQEPMLHGPLVAMAEPLVKWAIEVQRVEDLPRIVHRAAKIALSPPTGPVFISLPGDILDDEAEMNLGSPTRVETGVRPSNELVQRLARRLLSARRPVIIAGRELANRDAFDEAGELAELLGAAVFHEPVPYNARFATGHAAYMGDLTRNQRKVRETLDGFDLVVCLGADLLRMSPYSSIDPLPDRMPVVHVTERDWELGKNYATELAICANVKETLRALLPALKSLRTADDAAKADRRLRELKARNWSSQRESARKETLSAVESHPIDPRYLLMRFAEALPRNAVVVEEAVTAAPALSTFVPIDGPKSFYGLASGGLGFALPGAIGVSLAQPEHPVVAVVGDGSALYSVQALWTAAHLDLPITYVIINNRSYRILKDRLISMRKSRRFVGMDLTRPAIDFVGVARSMGMTGRRITEPSEIASSLQQAIESKTPNLLEVIVADGYGESPGGRH